MKRFLINTLLVIFSIMSINAVLDVYISYRLSQSKDRRYINWNDIINKQLNADMIIMGSSRAYRHYNPMILDSILFLNSYNQGLSGSGLNRQIIKYNIFSHYQKVTPKHIIVNIDYFSSLYWTIGYEREQFFPYMYHQYIRKQLKNIEPFSWAELFIPIYRYSYKGLFGVIKGVDNDNMVKGYIGTDMIWDATEYNKQESFHFEADDRTIRMFDEFLAARQNEGINLIFCYSPIYIGLTNKVDNLQDAYDTFQFFADKYDIPIIDYTYSEISKDTAYFYNATHLNKHGSELFTIQLAHDIDSLGLLNE